MQRTIRITLQPSPEQANALSETRRQFTDVFNAVTLYGWQARIKDVTLHHALYYPLKAQYPDLVSDVHVQALVKAAEAVASALQLAKDPERTVTQPRSWGCAPRYNTMDWQAQIVNLATVVGRQHIPFIVPDYARRYIRCTTDSADLLVRDGNWWRHVMIVVLAPMQVSDAQPNTPMIGVDLGLAQPAVTSNVSFLANDCHQCDYELHADLNGSYNIAAPYNASVGRSEAGGLPVTQPIASVLRDEVRAASLTGRYVTEPHPSSRYDLNQSGLLPGM